MYAHICQAYIYIYIYIYNIACHSTEHRRVNDPLQRFYKHTHISTCIHAHAHIHTHTQGPTQFCVHMHTCTHSYTYTRLIHTSAYICTHAHIHKHARISPCRWHAILKSITEGVVRLLCLLITLCLHPYLLCTQSIYVCLCVFM
jgi:hypothetical protein